MANPIQLTPAEIAEYENAAGSAAPVAINPLRDFSADELFDLAIKDKSNFDLIGEFRRNKDLWKDPATIQKVADVHSRIKDRGFELEDIPSAGKVARTVFDIAKGFGKQAWNYADALVVTPMVGAVGEITGQGPGFQTELAQEAQRKIMENLAGTESAAFGVARLAEKGIGKVRRAFVDQTPEEKLSDLWKDVGSGEAEEEILKGKGGLLEPLGSEVRKELEAAGKPIRPEETAQLAAGDPLSFYTFGKVFQGAGKGIKAGVTKVAERLPAKAVEVAAKVPAVAEKAAETVGGRTIQAAGTLTELGGKAIKIAAPAVGMVKGAIEAGPVGALAGLKGGEIAAKVGGKISKGGKALAEAGKEIAGAAPVTGGVTQLTKDVIGSVPMAATEVGKGLAFDIGTAALTSETPRDTESVGIGAFFGGMGAARRAGSRIISGQLVGPRAWGSDKVIPSSGQLPGLDAMHADAIQNATPAVQTRLNAIRQFLKGSHADTDVFLAKDAPSLENTLTQMGLSPEQARQFSQTEGFFVTDLPGANGQPRRVIIARNVDAAPHESFHAIQDVLGETANQAIDQIVREEYGPQWEAEGQRYASRIGEGDWREVILDSTGTGLNYAKEKIAMDVANEYRAATGAEPPSGFVQERVKAILGQVMDRAVQANPNVQPNDIATRVWRDILSPQEATAVADSYLARELAAENFDVVFKHGGPDLQNVSGLTGKLARIVAQLVSTLGGEPLSPERTSQIGDIAPRFRVTEAVREAPGLVQPRETSATLPKPEILPPSKPTTPSEPLPPTPPAQPEQPPTVDEARKIASEAPDVATVAGTASPREILGNVAEAIAQRAGLKVNYLSAEGEGPAASISSNREARRAVIEAFRTMPPEARALWEKNFFPDRVVKTKDKYQILGWAPEVFASNAHKLAAKLQELGVAEASPYAVKEGTFTPEAWQELFRDVQTFVQNQVGGRTGAGEPLVVPREITERGFFAPPVKGRAEVLPQLKADFISMLFGIKLPDTARIQKGRLPLNIAGQAVSEATKPGRTEIPVIPRGRFEGVEAERQGISGRDIMEVNPLRQQIEAAAQAKGVAMPEFIEAQQRLNLENIKNVEVAPELPEFRGNVLTLSAGFQPSAEPRAIKSAAVKDREGKIWEGPWHGDAEANAFAANAPGPYIDGFSTNTPGEFLTREQAYDRAVEQKQLREKVEGFLPPVLTPGGKDLISEGVRFQPKPDEPRAIKSAAVKFRNGKVFEGFTHADAMDKALREGMFKGVESHEELNNLPPEEFVKLFRTMTDGFVTNSNEFLTRDQAFARAEELKQLPEGRDPDLFLESTGPGLLEAFAFESVRRFQPKSAEDVLKMSNEDFSKWAQSMATTGGFTEAARQLGKSSKNPETLKMTYDALQEQGKQIIKDAIASGDPKQMESAAAFGSKAQFFREAYEAATNTGSMKEGIDTGAEIGETTVQMQPKKELKMKPAKQGFSKAWVLPNGKVMNLGGQWHHEFLNENNALRKLYDLPVTEGDENRVAALQKGFARINYSQNNGRLTVEARAADWPKLKKSVRDFVEANADQIDHIEVHLMDNPVEDVMHSDSVKVFTLEDNEKAAMTPFLDLGEGPKMTAASERLFNKAVKGAQMQPRGRRARQMDETEEALARTKEATMARWKADGGNEDVVEAVKGDQIDWRHFGDLLPDAVAINGSEDLPLMTPEILREAGYKSLDLRWGPSFHDPRVTPAFRTDEGGAWPVSETGIQQAYKHGTEQANEIWELSRESDAQFQPEDVRQRMDRRSRQRARGGRWFMQQATKKAAALDSELEKVREGTSSGQTFDSAGEVWEPKAADIVTLASVTVPTKELTPEKFQEVTAQYKELLQDPNVVSGVFAIDKDRASVDINAVVAQEHRDNTLQFAKDNNQISIWDASKSETVESGGTGETVLTDIDKIKAALPDLLAGKRVQFQPEKNLFGEDVEKEMTPREISKLSPEKLRKIYPEAVVPDDRSEQIPSKITESPLFKRSGSEEEAVKAFGNKLAEFARSKQNDPVAKAGAAWYEKFTPMLEKEFGKDAQLFAELLAATSPQTKLETNFGFALDAIDSFRKGRFKKQMDKFNQGLEMIAEDRWLPWYNKELKNIPNPPKKPSAAAFLEHWIHKHDLKPRQTNGKLYGTHSLPVLQVFARKWLTEARGLKTLNFVENLIGKGDEATIDLWADRTMRRIGYEGEERWRILPKNIVGVSDKDFKFSQKAFRNAADQLGMKPSALQGMLWFAEKQIWADNKWSELDLGDYGKEMEKIPAIRKKRLTPEPEKGKLKQKKLL